MSKNAYAGSGTLRDSLRVGLLCFLSLFFLSLAFSVAFDAGIDWKAGAAQYDGNDSSMNENTAGNAALALKS